jgi:hypothetical protein
MAKFVAQDRQDVLVLEVEQCVVEHDALPLPEPKEVCIAVTGALRAVDLKEIREWELVFFCQVLDLSLELLIFESFELIEERLNKVRVYPHERKYEHLDKGPAIQVEPISSRLHDPDECWDEQATKEVRQQLALAKVRNEEGCCHLVEAMLLLDDKV